MARLRVAGPKRTVADERKITVCADRENREISRLGLRRASQRVDFTITGGLVVPDQELMPGNAFLIRQNLEDEMLRLPLQNVRHLAPKILQQRLADAGTVAYIHPLIGAAQPKHSRLLGRVAEHAGPR